MYFHRDYGTCLLPSETAGSKAQGTEQRPKKLKHFLEHVQCGSWGTNNFALSLRHTASAKSIHERVSCHETVSEDRLGGANRRGIHPYDYRPTEVR